MDLLYFDFIFALLKTCNRSFLVVNFWYCHESSRYCHELRPSVCLCQACGCDHMVHFSMDL